MAGVKISALPGVASALLTDIFPVVQAGVTSQESLTQVSTLFQTIMLPLSGGTLTGALYLSSDPTTSTQAATKNYVDTLAAGLNPIPGVVAATTANLNTTYLNGVAGVGATLTDASGTFAAFTVDGQSPAVGSRILVKNQTTTYQNGIYVLTTNGDTVSVPYVLTRATDYNTPSQIQPGDLIAVETGTVNGGSSFYETATVVTIGVSAITFSAFFSPSNFLSSTLASAKIYVGNASNVGTAVSMSGDATLSNAGALTIAANAVTNAKLAQMAANTIKGNNTGSTANAADLTVAQVQAMILPAGTMFNLQSTTLTTTTSVNANVTWTNLTGLAVTITPTSSSNQVLIRAAINYSLSSNSFFHGLRILRGSTPIGVATSVGSTVAAGVVLYQDVPNNGCDTAIMEFLDSPATTSSTTYQIQAYSGGSELILINEASGDSGSSSNVRGVSTVTACEVVG